MLIRSFQLIIAGAASIFFGSTLAVAAPIVFQASGALDVAAKVAEFRAALGGPNNLNNPGPLGTGRREINWDGGTATDGTLAVNPFAGFRDARGATFITPGSGLTQTPITGGTQEIAPGLPGVQRNLAEINPTYADTFVTFSPNRLFVPLGSTITDSIFSLPGTNGGIPAVVNAFGAIFTDVDLANSTSLQYYDANNVLLETFFAPPGNNGLSFLGVQFDAGEQIARVRIKTGNNMLGPNDGSLSPVEGGVVDVVALDDVLYSEPQAIPEPATLLLVGTGFLGLAFWRHFRCNSSNSQ